MGEERKSTQYVHRTKDVSENFVVLSTSCFPTTKKKDNISKFRVISCVKEDVKKEKLM